MTVIRQIGPKIDLEENSKTNNSQTSPDKILAVALELPETEVPDVKTEPEMSVAQIIGISVKANQGHGIMIEILIEILRVNGSSTLGGPDTQTIPMVTYDPPTGLKLPTIWRQDSNGFT